MRGRLRGCRIRDQESDGAEGQQDGRTGDQHQGNGETTHDDSLMVEQRGRGGERSELAPLRAEESGEELEQHETCGLDRNDQALDQQQQGIAQDQDQDIQRGTGCGTGQCNHGRAQSGVRQRKCTDTGERQRIDQDLDRVFEQFPDGAERHARPRPVQQCRDDRPGHAGDRDPGTGR